MSEPLSSTEIEDVLSSIRRLVSDDLRPLHRPMPVSQPLIIADKLILTPALRVVQDEVASPVETATSAPYRLHLGIPAHADTLGLDQVVASVGAAVDAQLLEWEAETGDVEPFVAASQSGDWQDADMPAPFLDGSVAIVEDADDVFTTESFDDDMAVTQSDTAAPMPGWAQQDAEPDADMAVDDAISPTVAHGTMEPDPAWADAAEASVIASLAADSDPKIEPISADDNDEPMSFDEEVLRELVRDILREELAGQMGERITRNIRKLVRVEIARTFATQEFE